MKKNIPIEIIKFFNYDKNDLIGNLIYTAIFIFRSAIEKNEELIYKVLKLSGIDKDPILFLKLLEDTYTDIAEQQDSVVLQKTLKHAPHKIQKSPLTWPYYGLYWFCQKNVKFDEMKYLMPSNMAKIFFQFHYDMLTYKIQEFPKENKRSDKFYTDVARGVTRAVELLYGIYIKKDTLTNKNNKEYIKNIYFDEYNNDWLFNLYEIFENNDIEANSFQIKDGNKSSFYISYNNVVFDIGEWHFETSRKTQTGKSRKIGVNSNLRAFMSNYHENHLKMRNLIYKERRSGKSRTNSSKIISQYTVVEPFNKYLSISIDIPNNESLKEEAIEQENFKIKRKRCFSDLRLGELNTIPNVAQQRNINKAFSAKITKRSLLLKTDYETPPKEHLKEFIKYVFNDKMSSTFNLKDFFKSVFLTSLITGYDYNRIVTGIFLQLNNMIKYRDELNDIVIGVDPTLFSKEKKSDFLIAGEKKIFYRLPRLYAMLWSQQKNKMLELREEEINKLTSEELEKEYIDFMKTLQDNFSKKIKINFKQIWRIITTYRREQSIEDMSILFCVGKYQSCDMSRLAYTATLKNSVTSSEMMEKMYIDLNLHESVCKLLNISSELFRPALSTTRKPEYSGSSRVLDIKKSIKFFSEINRLMQLQNDSIAKFNIFSVALRFALSITLGTRTFSKSDSFEHMSMHTIRISEKAETISTGTRIVPLCETIENLINNYRNIALKLGFAVTQVMFISEGKIEPYNNKKAPYILKSYGASEYIQNFITQVPLNTGRHIITKHAVEHNFNSFYLEALLGHYISGGEHEGIFSTMNMKEYIDSTRNMLQDIAKIYGVHLL